MPRGGARGERERESSETSGARAADLRAARGGRVSIERRAAAGLVGGLSARQLEVLELVAVGMTNGEIAAMLVIAQSTANNHVHAILVRLDVARRGQATALLHLARDYRRTLDDPEKDEHLCP